MTITVERPHVVQTDARGRMSIGRPDETFILTEQVDGAILLEPAITMTTGEARILTDARIQERIAKARKGEGLVRRTSRRI